MTTIGVSGCKESKQLTRISYGTLVDTEAQELDYVDLAAKVNRGETMIVATYLDMSPQCGCWTTFKYILGEYVKEYKTKVYYIDRFDFPNGEDTFGLTINTKVTDPTVAFFKNGKKVNQYLYGNDTKPIFEQLSGLRKAVEKFARDPQYFLVDQDYLDKALFVDKNDRVVVQYIWNTCPDCNDCMPNVMMPYSDKNEFSTQVWLIDLAIKGLLLDEDGKQDKTQPGYVTFLKDHHVSVAGDTKFGYDRGFVPTTQVWEKGELKDMTVYFNDTVEKVEGQYKITQSYYTEDRVQNVISYDANVLEGKILSEEEVDVFVWNDDEYISWNKEYARKEHRIMLENFFDKYVK